MVRALLLVLLVESSLAVAGPLGIDQVRPDEKVFGAEMTDIKAHAEALTKGALDAESLDWVRRDEIKAVFPDDLEKISRKPPEPGKVDVISTGENFIIFVSWSMGEGQIREMLKEYDESGRVTLKFRGIPDGATMVQALAKIQTLAMETKSDVEVQIDPVAFVDNGVTEVPAVARRKDDKVVNIVRGTSSIEVFKGKEDTFDLGTLGATVEIAERDLIELMKERLANVDKEELKRKAIKRFWANQQFVVLDDAQETRLRKLDPTIVVPQEMRAPDGTLIHAAGARINPLDIRPFNQRLLIIDPAKEWQLTLARGQIDAFGKDQLITIILTSLPRDSGWEELKRVEDYLNQPAYLLQSDLRERFDLQKVPSIVTADKGFFFIQEVAKRDVK